MAARCRRCRRPDAAAARRAGLTLVELLVVIGLVVVLGVLARFGLASGRGAASFTATVDRVRWAAETTHSEAQRGGLALALETRGDNRLVHAPFDPEAAEPAFREGAPDDAARGTVVCRLPDRFRVAVRRRAVDEDAASEADAATEIAAGRAGAQSTPDTLVDEPWRIVFAADGGILLDGEIVVEEDERRAIVRFEPLTGQTVVETPASAGPEPTPELSDPAEPKP